MLFSGYNLGIHLLYPTTEGIILDREYIVKEGHLIIKEKSIGSKEEAQTRNSIFEIGVTKKTKKTFVKQARTLASNHILSIVNEMKIYDILERTTLKRYIPIRLGADPYFYLIFLEFIKEKSVRFQIDSEPVSDIFQLFLEELANVISKLHGINRINFLENDPIFSFNKPLFFQITRKNIIEQLLNSRTSNEKVVGKILNKDKVFEELKKISWTPNSLIHFDLKFDHFLFDILSNQNKQDLKVIDWEMADLGDLHWDIATIWYEILICYANFNTIDDAINKSIEDINIFLKEYKQPYDSKKIVQFLGIIILHKYYYNLFPFKAEESLIDSYLNKAEEFIINPDIIGNKIKPNTLTDFNFTEIALPANPPQKNIIIPKGGKLSSLEYDLESLFNILRSTFINQPSEKVLKTKIYKWFFGEFDIATSIQNAVKLRNDKVAVIPDAVRAERYSDLWWNVEARTRNGSLSIRKSSERRYEESGQFYFVSNSRSDFFTPRSIEDDAYVNLTFSKYSITRNTAVEEKFDLWIPGKQKIKQDFPNRIRFYFHLKDNLDGIHLFINEISTRLNEIQVPFEIKLRNDLNRFLRADSCILFVHRQHFNVCIDAITYVYNLLRNKGFIRAEIPKFLKKFNDINNNPFGGLGFGENPLTPDESFGNWRAQIITDALLENNNWNLTEQWMNIVKEKFIRLGFNIFELYRNPYPKNQEPKYRYDLFRNSLILPNIYNSNTNSSLDLLPNQKYLNAAKKIAHLICREAIWFGNKCNWISFKIEKNEENIEEPVFKALDKNEKLGVGLFISGISMLCPDVPNFRMIALGAINENKEELDHKSLYNYYLSQFKKPNNSNNFITTSVQFFYNEIFNSGKDFTASELIASNIIKKHIDMNIPFPNAYVKDWDSPFGSEFCPTITHGLSALGYFLLDLSEQNNIDTIILEPLNNILKPSTKLIQSK